MGLMFSRFVGWLGLPGILGIVVGATLGFMLMQQKIETARWHHSSTKFEQQWQDEKAAHQQTRLNMQAAALKALQAQAARNAENIRQQNDNLSKVYQTYDAKIAAARADAQRLRDELAKAGAHPGVPPAGPVSDHRGPGSAPAPAPQEDGFSVDDRLLATEQAIQLDALIDYVEGLLRIDPNGKAPAR